MSEATLAAGIDRSDRAADPEWVDAVELRICEIAQTRQFFVVDDIWTDQLESDARLNAHIGPVLMRAKSSGLISRVAGGYMSERANHSGVSVWRSNVCDNGVGVHLFTPTVVADLMSSLLVALLGEGVPLREASARAVDVILDLGYSNTGGSDE